MFWLNWFTVPLGVWVSHVSCPTWCQVVLTDITLCGLSLTFPPPVHASLLSTVTLSIWLCGLALTPVWPQATMSITIATGSFWGHLTLIQLDQSFAKAWTYWSYSLCQDVPDLIFLFISQRIHFDLFNHQYLVHTNLMLEVYINMIKEFIYTWQNGCSC